MARVAIIAAALARMIWRDFRSLGSIAGNNLFFFLLFVLLQPGAALFPMVLLGLPLLLLLGGDALVKIPPERLPLWPLSSAQGVALRIVSLALNPLVWLAAGFWLAKRQGASALLFLGILAVSQFVVAAVHRLGARRWQRSLWTVIPSGNGWFGALVAKDLRQLLSTLDPYPLLMLAIATFIYRVAAAEPDRSAFTIISVLLAIGVSTFAQSSFGLDGQGGVDRYRLMPLGGSKILLAKGAAVLAVLLLLVLPLRPDVGVAGGLTALAIGHHSSVLQPLPQQRWRFSSGRIWPVGLMQIVGAIAMGMAVAQWEVWILLAFAGYAASLFLYGSIWDRKMTRE